MRAARRPHESGPIAPRRSSSVVPQDTYDFDQRVARPEAARLGQQPQDTRRRVADDNRADRAADRRRPAAPDGTAPRESPPRCLRRWRATPQSGGCAEQFTARIRQRRCHLCRVAFLAVHAGRCAQHEGRRLRCEHAAVAQSPIGRIEQRHAGLFAQSRHLSCTLLRARAHDRSVSGRTSAGVAAARPPSCRPGLRQSQFRRNRRGRNRAAASSRPRRCAASPGPSRCPPRAPATPSPRRARSNGPPGGTLTTCACGAAARNTCSSGSSGGGDSASRANPVCRNGTPWTCTTPRTSVRPCAGKAGATTTLGRPEAVAAASVSAATLPRSVESIFLIRISACAGQRRSTTSRTTAAASEGGRWREAQFTDNTSAPASCSREQLRWLTTAQVA